MNRSINNKYTIIDKNSNLMWHEFKGVSLPPEDVDVLAYNKKWIDEDFNPKGIRIGFREEDRFYSAQRNDDSNYSTHCSDDNDYYDHNGKDELPEYWVEIPEFTFK